MLWVTCTDQRKVIYNIQPSNPGIIWGFPYKRVVSDKESTAGMFLASNCITNPWMPLAAKWSLGGPLLCT